MMMNIAHLFLFFDFEPDWLLSQPKISEIHRTRMSICMWHSFCEFNRNIIYMNDERFEGRCCVHWAEFLILSFFLFQSIWQQQKMTRRTIIWLVDFFFVLSFFSFSTCISFSSDPVRRQATAERTRTSNRRKEASYFFLKSKSVFSCSSSKSNI
jgi:hypothetical protein